MEGKRAQQPDQLKNDHWALDPSPKGVSSVPGRPLTDPVQYLLGWASGSWLIVLLSLASAQVACNSNQPPRLGEQIEAESPSDPFPRLAEDLYAPCSSDAECSAGFVCSCSNPDACTRPIYAGLPGVPPNTCYEKQRPIFGPGGLGTADEASYAQQKDQPKVGNAAPDSIYQNQGTYYTMEECRSQCQAPATCLKPCYPFCAIHCTLRCNSDTDCAHDFKCGCNLPDCSAIFIFDNLQNLCIRSDALRPVVFPEQ